MAVPKSDETRIISRKDYDDNGYADEAGTVQDKPKKSRKLKALNAFLVALMAIILGCAGFFGVQYFLVTNEVQVPNVVGQRELDAERALLEKKLVVVYDEGEYDDQVPAGEILRQTPEGGSVVKEGREITLVVSLGANLIEVPEVTGKNKNDAKAELENKGLSLGHETTNYSPDVPEGEIILQIPRAGEQVKAGTKVDVTISLGPTPQMVTIPNLKDKTLAEAKTELTKAGLTLGSVTEEESYTKETGVVLGQSLAAGGQTMQDTSIDLTVSKGPGPDAYKIGKVEMLVPQSGTMVLELIDDDGRAIIYSKEWLEGDYLSTEFTYKGSGQVNIYCNDQLVETVPLS